MTDRQARDTYRNTIAEGVYTYQTALRRRWKQRGRDLIAEPDEGSSGLYRPARSLPECEDVSSLFALLDDPKAAKHFAIPGDLPRATVPDGDTLLNASPGARCLAGDEGYGDDFADSGGEGRNDRDLRDFLNCRTQLFDTNGRLCHAEGRQRMKALKAQSDRQTLPWFVAMALTPLVGPAVTAWLPGLTPVATVSIVPGVGGLLFWLQQALWTLRLERSLSVHGELCKAFETQCLSLSEQAASALALRQEQIAGGMGQLMDEAVHLRGNGAMAGRRQRALELSAFLRERLVANAAVFAAEAWDMAICHRGNRDKAAYDNAHVSVAAPYLGIRRPTLRRIGTLLCGAVLAGTALLLVPQVMHDVTSSAWLGMSGVLAAVGLYLAGRRARRLDNLFHGGGDDALMTEMSRRSSVHARDGRYRARHDAMMQRLTALLAEPPVNAAAFVIRADSAAGVPH